LVQKELGERRGNWMTTIQEYYLEIKNTTIIKWKSLYRLVAESQDHVQEEKEG
jgi:hypothetical protein